MTITFFRQINPDDRFQVIFTPSLASGAYTRFVSTTPRYYAFGEIKAFFQPLHLLKGPALQAGWDELMKLDWRPCSIHDLPTEVANLSGLESNLAAKTYQPGMKSRWQSAEVPDDTETTILSIIRAVEAQPRPRSAGMTLIWILLGLAFAFLALTGKIHWSG
ncbi:MAG: hypothetical protein GC129_06390 [Proteobacteria bacterium]|nr:hypothetical protein [Pseudomonadota bacterium]